MRSCCPQDQFGPVTNQLRLKLVKTGLSTTKNYLGLLWTSLTGCLNFDFIFWNHLNFLTRQTSDYKKEWKNLNNLPTDFDPLAK
jgi:hypothetical protein